MTHHEGGAGVPPVPDAPTTTGFDFRRSRTYAFVVDATGRPVEIGSGRFARVYLGREWRRHRADRRSTFSSGGVAREVESIAFPEPGLFTYRLKGDSEDHSVRLQPPEGVNS